MSAVEEPQVAWTAVEADAALVTTDGSEIGRVREIVGDKEADIFDGLVVKTSSHGPDRYVPSERVRRMWPHRVEVELTAAEAEALSEYKEPVTVRWDPAKEGRLGARLRAALKDLFGPRRR
ncbi:MAG: hypothetical protein WBB74_01465 [Gaiellaceae bacterium]